MASFFVVIQFIYCIKNHFILYTFNLKKKKLKIKGLDFELNKKKKRKKRFLFKDFIRKKQKLQVHQNV